MVLIDSWPYDLVVSGELTAESEVTDFTVSRGSNISDNIKPQPIELTLEVVVSDSPLGEIANHDSRRIDDVTKAVFGSDQIPLPSAEAYERLMDIRDSKRTVIIEIPVASRQGKPGKRTFLSMALSHLSDKYGPDNAGGAFFGVTFKQIRVVDNKRVTVKTATPAGQPTQKKAATATALVPIYTFRWRMGAPPGSFKNIHGGTMPLTPGDINAGVSPLNGGVTWAEVTIDRNKPPETYMFTGISSFDLDKQKNQLLTPDEVAAMHIDVHRDSEEFQRRNTVLVGSTEGPPRTLPGGIDVSRFTEPTATGLPSIPTISPGSVA